MSPSQERLSQIDAHCRAANYLGAFCGKPLDNARGSARIPNWFILLPAPPGYRYDFDQLHPFGGDTSVSQVAAAGIKQEIGAPVDDFQLTAVSGEISSLQAHLEDRKGAVVVFWSGVCSHCVRYDEYLNSFAQRHPEIALLAVASRQGETVEQIRATIAARQLKFSMLHDPGGKVAERWAVQQTPRVFLVDSNRVLLYRGAIDNFKYPDDPEHIAYLDPAVGQFLAGEPIIRTETASFGCAIRSVYYILPKAL